MHFNTFVIVETCVNTEKANWFRSLNLFGVSCQRSMATNELHLYMHVTMPTLCMTVWLLVFCYGHVFEFEVR